MYCEAEFRTELIAIRISNSVSQWVAIVCIIRGDGVRDGVINVHRGGSNQRSTRNFYSYRHIGHRSVFQRMLSGGP